MGAARHSTEPSKSKQLSLPVYTGKRYIIKYTHQFKNKGTQDQAVLGFLALFHADQGNWVEFEVQGILESACKTNAVLWPEQSAQAPQQPSTLDYLKYNPNHLRDMVFHPVPKADQGFEAAEEQMQRAVDTTGDASNYRYGMCYSTSEVLANHGDGLRGCPMLYFDNEWIEKNNGNNDDERRLESNNRRRCRPTDACGAQEPQKPQKCFLVGATLT